MSVAQGPIWHLPFRRNPFFTGRAQVLSDLRAMLLASSSAALVQPPAINGLGGIGKTQTAIEYAYRYREEYAAVFWVQASSRETLIAEITRIAALLHLPEQDAREQDLILQAFKRWLAANTGWLLIFDNTDDLYIVEDILPARNSGHILFTTRATAMGDLAQRVTIDEMDRAEGSLLLLRRAKKLSIGAPLTDARPADLAAAQAITGALDGLPLALDQAGAYIEEAECSLTDYLQLYRTHLLEERAKRKDAHPEPVATTWAISFKNVQQANAAAADLMRLCAFLAPDAIPEAMILEAPEDIGTELQSLVGNQHKLNMALKELLKYSLIRRDSTNHTIVVHRLVQAVLRGEMDEETRKQWAERAIKIVNWSFPDVKAVEEWPKCLQWLPHALVCASFIKQWKLAFSEAVRLLDQAGYYLGDRAQYQEAESLHEQMLSIRKEVLGERHPDTAQSLNNLGYLYHKQGKFVEAEPLYKQALSIRKEVLGERHPDTAQSLNNLAALYGSQGKLAEAEPLYKQALSIRKEVLGERHPDTAQSLNNLAALYSSQSKLELAEPLYQQALAIWKEVLGDLHPDIAQSLNNLAALYDSQGKLTEAEPLYQQALAIRQDVLGELHPDTALSLNNLGYLYRAQGKLAEAEPLYRQALAILKQVLGPDHPDTRIVQDNYDRLLRQMKRGSE